MSRPGAIHKMTTNGQRMVLTKMSKYWLTLIILSNTSRTTKSSLYLRTTLNILVSTKESTSLSGIQLLLKSLNTTARKLDPKQSRRKRKMNLKLITRRNFLILRILDPFRNKKVKRKYLLKKSLGKKSSMPKS